MIAIVRTSLLAGAAALMACAPSASPQTNDLSPASQAEFLESIKSANGSVLLKGADISSAAVATALSSINSRKANVVVLVQRESLSNTDSKIDLVASKFKGSLINSVFIATGETTIAPFALIGTRAFYGPGLLKDGEAVLVAGTRHDYKTDLEQFTSTPKRIYTGK